MRHCKLGVTAVVDLLFLMLDLLGVSNEQFSSTEYNSSTPHTRHIRPMHAVV